jgi:Baseplate J-like protein
MSDDSSNSVRAPKFDNRNYKDILEELRSYAPFYIPEWDPKNDNDIGTALSKIFCHIMINVTDRLNKIPTRNYIEFLNMLGIKLSPARAASADVIFLPSVGVKNEVMVRSGSRLVAPANDKHDEIIFETQENLLVTNSELVDVWSTSGRKSNKDGIYQHTQEHIANLPFDLFFGDNQQKHILYMRDQSVFNIKTDSKIVVQFDCNNAKALSTILKDADWEYNWKLDPDSTNQEIVSKFYAETSHKNNTCTVRISLIKYGHVKFDKYVLKVGEILNLEVEARDPAVQPLVIMKSTTDPHGKIIAMKQIPTSVMFHGNIRLVSEATLSSYKHDEEILVVHEDDIVTATYMRNNFESTSAGIVNSRGTPKIEENEVASITGYWIRCSLSPENFVQLKDTINSLTINDIKVWNQAVSISPPDSFVPDMLFYNNVPLSTEPILPFGEKPILLDTFYIASESVLSKKNTDIMLSFKCLNTTSLLLKSHKPILTWEYWNGITWTTLKIDNQTPDPDNNLSQWIKFLCPTDISPTEVNGVQNFWIRSRIIIGDYGKEKLVPDPAGSGPNPEYIVDVSEIKFPQIFNVHLSFSPNPKQPKNCISYNNLEHIDHILKVDGTIIPFIPFYGLPEDIPAIYYGFNKQLAQGSLNLYISIHQFDYQDNNNNISSINNNKTSSVRYYYYSVKGKNWKELDVIDGTRDYIKSGYLKILIPPDISTYSLFGKTRYWIKALDKKSIFKSAIDHEIRCPGYYVGNSNIKEKSNRVLPYINGLYLNTVSSVNLERIDGEIIGSSNGEQNQYFKFSKVPVVSSNKFQTEMWINEARSISEDDVEKFKNIEGIREVKGLDGVVREIWVRWREVEDITLCDHTDRCYESDNAVGLIRFGDDIHGKIPPIGRDNIKVSYHRGGGLIGNVEQREISLVKSPIPFIESVMNPERANGGMDIEKVQDVLLRGPQLVKHRGQAVTSEDFEWLVREKFPSIVRVKCLPNSWTRGEFKPGHVVVVVVPQSSEDKPIPSLELMEMIEHYLHTCSSNIVISSNSLRVISPVFIKISVTADVYVKSIELVSDIEKEAKESLKKFLHPLKGGDNGNGWDLGSLLCFSDFYSLFHKIDSIDHVDNLSVDIELEENSSMLGDLSECKRVCKIKFDDIADPSKNILPILKHSLIFSGEHDLAFKLSNTKGGQ